MSETIDRAGFDEIYDIDNIVKMHKSIVLQYTFITKINIKREFSENFLAQNAQKW